MIEWSNELLPVIFEFSAWRYIINCSTRGKFISFLVFEILFLKKFENIDFLVLGLFFSAFFAKKKKKKSYTWFFIFGVLGLFFSVHLAFFWFQIGDFLSCLQKWTKKIWNVLHQRMVLRPSNYDFWVQRVEIHNKWISTFSPKISTFAKVEYLEN